MFGFWPLKHFLYNPISNCLQDSRLMELLFAQMLLVPPYTPFPRLLFKWLPSSPISTVMLKCNTHLTLSRITIITIIPECPWLECPVQRRWPASLRSRVEDGYRSHSIDSDFFFFSLGLLGSGSLEPLCLYLLWPTSLLLVKTWSISPGLTVDLHARDQRWKLFTCWPHVGYS